MQRMFLGIGVMLLLAASSCAESSPESVMDSSATIVNPTERLATATLAPDILYLADLEPLEVEVGHWILSVGSYEFNSHEDGVEHGDALIAHDQKFAKGIYAHAPSRLIYEIPAGYVRFETSITLVDRVVCGDGAQFVVKLDGIEAFHSENLDYSNAPENVVLDLGNTAFIELITEIGDEGDPECDWTIWGDPFLKRGSE